MDEAQDTPMTTWGQLADLVDAAREAGVYRAAPLRPEVHEAGWLTREEGLVLALPRHTDIDHTRARLDEMAEQVQQLADRHGVGHVSHDPQCPWMVLVDTEEPVDLAGFQAALRVLVHDDEVEVVTRVDGEPPMPIGARV